MNEPVKVCGEQETPPGSELTLGGLAFGIGALDAREVLRYMDVTFRSRQQEEPDEFRRGEATK